MTTGLTQLDWPRLETTGIVAVSASIASIESALGVLRPPAFDRTKLSILATDGYDGDRVLGVALEELELTFWGKNRIGWKRIASRLPGVAFLSVPFVGHVLVFGALVGGLVGVTPRLRSEPTSVLLSDALARLGVDIAARTFYETALRTGDILLLAHGSEQDIMRARRRVSEAAAHGNRTHRDVQ